MIITEVEKYLQEVSWEYANQTMKQLMKLFYEKTNTLEKFEWYNVPENAFEKMPTEKDINKLESVIIEISVFLYAFAVANPAECVNDTRDSKELETFMMDELGLRGLNPLLDRILAYALIVLLQTTDDFSDAETNAKLLGKYLESVMKVANDIQHISKDCPEELLEENVSIDTSKLEIGSVVKNYKEMCGILDEEVLQGNSKKAQLKEWERHFCWEKKGQKFIILDVYEVPLHKNDGRQNKNIYVQYIEVILLKLLSNQKNNGYIFHITMNQLWKLLGMISNDYKNITLEDLNSRITEYNVTSFDMKKFYQRCNQRLREILFSSLNNLQARSLINYEMEVVIVSLDENGKLNYEVADDRQKKKILKAERKVLLDMGLESKRQVYAKMKDTEFFERLSLYLQEWYGWEYTYNRIKIIYNKPDIIDTVGKDELKLKNNFNEIRLQRLALNDEVVNALNKNVQTMVENRHKKADEEYRIAIDNYMEENSIIGSVPKSFLPSKRTLGIFDYPPYFVEIQNRLTDELISLREKPKRKTIIEFNDDDQSDLDELF